MFSGHVFYMFIDESTQICPEIFHDYEHTIRFLAYNDFIYFGDVFAPRWMFAQCFHDLYFSQYP